jgi:hypothetical protein
MGKREGRDEYGDHERREHEHRERPHGTGFGREREAYLQYLARRWLGSNPPTAEAYARAIRLWHQLPGSVVTVPADVAAMQPPAPVNNPNDLPAKPANNPDNGERGS